MSDESIRSYRMLDEPSRPIAGLSIGALAAGAAIVTIAFTLIKLGAPFRAVFTVTLVIGGPVFLTAAIGTGPVSIVRELRAAIGQMLRPGSYRLAESKQGIYLAEIPDAEDDQQ
ncbi:MAG TPA: hypothetical protein PKB03_00140 [Baekduia sp.]|nr:hypothetical protein [Baekduia sp.]